MISKALGNILFIGRCHGSFERIRRTDEVLAPSHLFFISYICRNPGCRQDALAEACGVDKTRVTHRLNELEKMGYITRTVCETDARARLIYPADKAKAVYPGIHENYENFTEQILEGLSPEEIDELTRLTDIVRENARRMIREMR